MLTIMLLLSKKIHVDTCSSFEVSTFVGGGKCSKPMSYLPLTVLNKFLKALSQWVNWHLKRFAAVFELTSFRGVIGEYSKHQSYLHSAVLSKFLQALNLGFGLVDIKNL